MFVRYKTVLAAILLPALVVFGIQWSLEVFHPIEEELVEHHHEEYDGVAVYDGSICDLGDHGQHLCAHSNVVGQAVHLAAAFRSGHYSVSTLTAVDSVIHRTPTSISERGPPSL